MKKVTGKFFDIIVKLKVALYANKIGIIKLSLTLNPDPNPNTILHLNLKNLTNKISHSYKGVQFVKPKRRFSREDSASITVTSQIQFVERSRRGISGHNAKTGALWFQVCYH